ncbi:MAG: low molecular weight protein-tyrosine-phosphatase [Pseudomonadota bacterium]
MTKRILFVCLGNICRSPAAEGILRTRARDRDIDLFIDSAGTGAWHVGDPPDARMIQAAGKRGYAIGHQRARKVDLADFYEFDYLLAMDLSNHTDLLDLAPPNRSCDIRLFLDFADCETRETPDPYYGGADGFARVLDLIELGVDGFLGHLEDESE